MKPLLLVALLVSPISDPAPTNDDKIKLVQKAWLSCYLENQESNCYYKEPERFFDTFTFWRKSLEECVEAAVKCEVGKNAG